MRRGLWDVLEFEDDLMVVGEVDSADTARTDPGDAPQVALLDVRLPMAGSSSRSAKLHAGRN